MDQHEKIDRNKPDIPDFNEQEIPQAKMSEEALAERNVRRYIRKDGMFKKDFEHCFDRNTGELDSGGRMIYVPTMTKAEAQAFITDLCENTGRKVVIDTVSKRPRAEPGYNLNIRVQGMSQTEQKAATVPEGVLRERLNNQLILDQRNSIDELTSLVKKLLAEKKETAAAESKTKAKGEDKLEALKIDELRILADDRNIDLNGLFLKADIIEKIRSVS